MIATIGGKMVIYIVDEAEQALRVLWRGDSFTEFAATHPWAADLTRAVVDPDGAIWIGSSSLPEGQDVTEQGREFVSRAFTSMSQFFELVSLIGGFDKEV